MQKVKITVEDIKPRPTLLELATKVINLVASIITLLLVLIRAQI